MFQIEDREFLKLSSKTKHNTSNLVYPNVAIFNLDHTYLTFSIDDIMNTVKNILLFMQTSRVYILDTSNEYYNINRIFINYLIDSKLIYLDYTESNYEIYKLTNDINI